MERSSSSSDESFEEGFWNDWLPPSIPAVDQSKTKVSNQPRASEDVVPSRASFTLFTDDAKFGNWIPPSSLLRTPLKTMQNTTLKEKAKKSHGQRETSFCERTSQTIKEQTQTPQVTEVLPGSVAVWRRELNLNWGERVHLHDVTKFNDGDLTWGIVNLGIFANIRLWVNEYGNICGLADGKITKFGSSEVTFISIKSTQLLRKMLSLSSAQWASLCETVLETKAILKFDAFEVSELNKKTSLEKLWFFVCKRRHFLPNQCMLVKLCGAVKCLRKFKITTKLVVQDIRTLLGEPILD